MVNARNHPLVALHRSVRLDNCWPNEIATFITRNLNMASVKVDLATLLLSRSDQSKNSVLGSRRNNGSATWGEKRVCRYGTEELTCRRPFQNHRPSSSFWRGSRGPLAMPEHRQLILLRREPCIVARRLERIVNKVSRLR